MESKKRRRLIIIAVVSVVVSLLIVQSCTIRTPEIHGVVLDAETKEPVENAWISSTLTVKSLSIQGDVTGYITLDRPHTRTDKDGRFVIPARFSIAPVSSIENISINASTIDDKSGGFYLKRIDYMFRLKTKQTIYVKPWEEQFRGRYPDVTPERLEELIDIEEFSSLRGLYDYCLYGRFSVERPSVKTGCDDWELDYAITKHERFLNKLGEPKTMDQGIHYSGVMENVGYLYKKRGDFIKALEIFKKVKAFDEKRGVTLDLKEYEHQINELEQLITGPERGKK